MKILKFWAPWCAPCKKQGELLQEFTTVPVKSINIEEAKNQDLVIKYDIRNLPTLILVDGDKEIKRFAGLISAEKLKEEIINV